MGRTRGTQRQRGLRDFWSNGGKTPQGRPKTVKSEPVVNVKSEPIEVVDLCDESPERPPPLVVAIAASDESYVNFHPKNFYYRFPGKRVIKRTKTNKPGRLEEIILKLLSRNKSDKTAAMSGSLATAFLRRNIAAVGRGRFVDEVDHIDRHENMHTPEPLDESILDRDSPISFTQFLCASNPVRGYYTLWHIRKMDSGQCTTPAEVFSKIEEFSESQIVERCVSKPPPGGVPGLRSITYSDLSPIGRSTLMRWARHVQTKDVGYESGENEDAVELWNRTVRSLKQRASRTSARR